MAMIMVMLIVMSMMMMDASCLVRGVVDLLFIFMIMKALLEGLVYYEVMPTWKDLVWFRT